MDPKHVWDPEILETMTAVLDQRAQVPPVASNDFTTLRKNADEILGFLYSKQTDSPDVESDDHYTSTDDGYSLLMRWSHKEGSSSMSRTPAVVFCHGGAMIAGSTKLSSRTVARFVSLSSVPVLSVEYRLAPEYPHPAPTEDVYTALKWLHAHAAELNVDTGRIAIMGESADGGIAAGVALMARDRGLTPKLAAQVLTEPMLDDRTMSRHPHLEDFFIWRTTDNIAAWSALLGHDVSGNEAATKDVSPYAAPARARSLKDLPRTFLGIGTVDRFVDETLEYGVRLLKAGVTVEFHCRLGVPHAYEQVAPELDVSKRAEQDKVKFLSSV